MKTAELKELLLSRLKDPKTRQKTVRMLYELAEIVTAPAADTAAPPAAISPAVPAPGPVEVPAAPAAIVDADPPPVATVPPASDQVASNKEGSLNVSDEILTRIIGDALGGYDPAGISERLKTAGVDVSLGVISEVYWYVKQGRDTLASIKEAVL